MSKREKDFFNEATKQIRDSYVFQSDGTYSDDDVRDIAISLAEYGYQYAVDKACEWLRENIYHRVYECGDRLGYPTADFLKDFRKAMQ